MNSIIHIGFTGSRLGMSDIQKDILFRTLIKSKHPGILHHGDCIGSDAQAHDIARSLKWTIFVHPPINPRLRAWKQGDKMFSPKEYYVRNKDIVDSCAYLIGCPNSQQEIGGTWQTINYAKENNRQFSIILPDGTMGHSVLTVGKERIL